MRVSRLILREIRHRRLSFALGVLSVLVAVGVLVAELTILRKHEKRTDQLVAAKEAEVREKMAKLEEDYRKITLGMGFNVLILPKDQNLSDLYADDYASKYMPEEYATRLAKSRVATINHVLPSLQQKVKWAEYERTIILMGVRGEVYIQSSLQKPLLEPVPAGTLMIGHELSRSLKLDVGAKVRLLGHEFTVSKINPERGNKDDITVWANLLEAQAMLGRQGQINAILALDCTCDTLDRLGRIRAEIQRILPDTQIIEFQTQALARAEARQRAAAEARESVEREKFGRARLRQEREAFAAVLVPVVMIGAAIWIGFLALANVRERRPEIAILRALGLRSTQILFIFLGKAVLTGLAGALLGYVVGATVGALWTETGPAQVSVPWLNPVLLMIVLAIAPALAAVASWLPALLAAQQDPAEILSKE